MFLLRVTEGNDFENDEIQMEVCCPSGKEIPQCDSESIEINDMIDLLPKILKSLEDAGQKESFFKFMGLTAAVFVIRFSDVKPIWYGTVHPRFQRIKKNFLRCSIHNLSKVADPGHKVEEFSMKS
jgi:hypothetical protein